MDEPKSLDSLFKEKVFRIPDFQRGYAWQREQLKAFWEDLVNLSDRRSHYTGVLTLKQIPATEVAESSNEYWLVDDHSYKIYHIVDGQRRLTTSIVFLQALVDFVKSLPENQGQPDNAIYLTDSLNLAALQNWFLFKTKPTSDQFRTYKFPIFDTGGMKPKDYTILKNKTNFLRASNFIPTLDHVLRDNYYRTSRHGCDSINIVGSGRIHEYFRRGSEDLGES